MRHILLSIGLLLCATFAQAGEVKRTELSRTPLSGVPGWDVVIIRLELEPGATLPLHSHPGDEYTVVVQGGKARVPSGAVVPFQPGQTLRFPADETHGGLTVVSEKPMVAITTTIIPAGQLLLNK